MDRPTMTRATSTVDQHRSHRRAPQGRWAKRHSDDGLTLVELLVALRASWFC